MFGQDRSPPEVIITGTSTQDFDDPAGIDKTGTPIKDLPRSIQVIPRALIDEQGATKLADTLNNVSGAVQGGQYAFGFFDRVIIRGLNVTYLNDGLPDQTSDLTGFVHALVGIDRVEVLKGPGSALYGDTEEGGTVNLVHARPADRFKASLSEQAGSFGSTTTDASATGPTGFKDLDWRIDAEYAHADGFRGLFSDNEAVLPALSWRPERHDVELRLEHYNLDALPDAAGLPFSPPSGTGKPLGVSDSDRYFTPYADAKQEITRLFASDAWNAADGLQVNNRFSYSDRSVTLFRNSGGSVTPLAGLSALTKRQLRSQQDNIDDIIYQLEPTWQGVLAGFQQTILAGFESRGLSGHTQRATADLPNIANIFNPVVTDGAPSSLTFKCDAAHSCDDADLAARFYGLYATDQITLTDSLKLRLSGRQDWFHTEGTAQTSIPANPGQEQPCTPARKGTECPWLVGVPVSRDDSRLSWDVGAVYFLMPNLSLFAGHSTDSYPIFNTEEPESIGQVPERSSQDEAGLRFTIGHQLALSSSLYRASRQNVFVVLADALGNDVPSVFSYRVRGWETDLNAVPLSGWTLNANYSEQFAIIGSYPQTPADIGKAVPSVPTHLANLWTSYDLSFRDPVGVLRASFAARYHDRDYGDAGNSRVVPGATLLDVGLALPRQGWTLALGVDNFLDRRNFLYAAGTGGGALPGAGRTIFGRLSATLW